MAEEKKDSQPKKATERTYLVRYRLPGEGGRTPRTIMVSARNQSDAKRTATATIPAATIVGGAKEISEGVIDFAGRVGNFMKRCVGRGCIAYARTPIKDTGTISSIRKRLTREIAQSTGEKLIRSGGGSPPPVKITMAKASKKRKGKSRGMSFLKGKKKRK